MTNTTARARAAMLGAALLTSCANYDFSQARTPTGDWDFAKLIHDLDESGRSQFAAWTWIPPFYFGLVTFARSDANMPTGYTLQQLNGFGPLWCVGNAGKRILDEHGERIESWDRNWFGWRLLHDNYANDTMTTHGDRHERDWRTILVLNDEETWYDADAR